MFKMLISKLYFFSLIIASVPMSVQTPPLLKTNLNDCFDYFSYCRNFQIEGKALFDFKINLNGKVDDIQIIELPFGVYEQTVLESISKLEFTPAKINGKPIEVRYRMPISFMN